VPKHQTKKKYKLFTLSRHLAELREEVGRMIQDGECGRDAGDDLQLILAQGIVVSSREMYRLRKVRYGR
jgi:hypothetical protein